MDLLSELLLRYGVLIIFTAVAASRLGLPLPAAPLLVVAGGLSATGQLQLPWVLVATLTASLAGDSVWFSAGRRYGHRTMKLLCRLSLSPDSCVRQGESLIVRWGGVSLVAAKFVPGVSIIASPMAGALAMPWLTFLAFQVAAAVVWSGLYLALGWIYRERVRQLLGIFQSYGPAAFVALGAALAVTIGLRYWRRHRFLRDLDVPRVGVEELRELLKSEAPPVVIDVRSAAMLDIDARRLPGAVLVSLDSVGDFAKQLPVDGEVVLYCNCPNEVSAVQAARLLASLGIKRARPLTGGLDAWFDHSAHA